VAGGALLPLPRGHGRRGSLHPRTGVDNDPNRIRFSINNDANRNRIDNDRDRKRVNNQ